MELDVCLQACAILALSTAGLRLQPEQGTVLYDEAAQAILKITEDMLFVNYLTQPDDGPKVNAGLHTLAKSLLLHTHCRQCHSFIPVEMLLLIFSHIHSISLCVLHLLSFSRRLQPLNSSSIIFSRRPPFKSQASTSKNLQIIPFSKRCRCLCSLG